MNSTQKAAKLAHSEAMLTKLRAQQLAAGSFQQGSKESRQWIEFGLKSVQEQIIEHENIIDALSGTQSGRTIVVVP